MAWTDRASCRVDTGEALRIPIAITAAPFLHHHERVDVGRVLLQLAACNGYVNKCTLAISSLQAISERNDEYAVESSREVALMLMLSLQHSHGAARSCAWLTSTQAPSSEKSMCEMKLSLALDTRALKRKKRRAAHHKASVRFTAEKKTKKNYRHDEKRR